MDTIKFEPSGHWELKGRGTVFTGPCPLDGSSDEQNIRLAVGRFVEVSGRVFRIDGVETRSLVRPPKLGEPVGLLLSGLGHIPVYDKNDRRIDQAWVVDGEVFSHPSP